ncbi:MAG: 2Fe-2S iron-sulfur cluster binding domain-containing protein [Lewinellaceae bacterium]|nr:2Fe-2S iron-sulfur cluster binding domain-containing protein [Lewinellaceae bacterium]
MPKVHYPSINQSVEYEPGESTLLDISIENKIPHLHECGGNGNCTTCRVRILDGHQHLSRKTLKEQKAASLRKWDPSIRLACQCYPSGEVSLQRLIWSSAEVNKLQLEAVPEGEAEERAIAILFCDMRNYTTLAGEQSTYDTAFMLNRFYTILGEPILMNNGIIYQYVGDEIIGIFGTSGGGRQKNCLDAVRAALGIQHAVNRLNETEFRDFGTSIQVGVGLHFGRAFIGHLGHPQHRQFTVVGDPVNVASRIQGLTRETETGILLSETVYKSLDEGLLSIRHVHNRHLKGKEASFLLYEIEGFTETDIHLELQSSLDYILKNEDGFAARFYDHVFAAAPQVRALFPRDMTAQGRMITHMLSGIIFSLSRPENLKNGLRKLGKNHEKYGVRPEYYPVVLECLLNAVREEMGGQYTERVGYAWRQGLSMIIGEMKNWQAGETEAEKHRLTNA